MVPVKKTFTAEINVLLDLIIWLRSSINVTCFTKKDLNSIELAVEEAFINIIKHGYKEQKGTIEITIDNFDDRVEITIKDSARAFNPIAQSIEIDKESSLDKREEGGLGVFFLKNNMDRVIYNREGNNNLLVLIKNCHNKK